MSLTNKKKRGRPKGSKTKKKPVVRQVVARCPHCGGSELRVIKGAPTRVLSHCGVDTAGEKYTSTKWADKQCVACGGVATVMWREFDPGNW